jgi:hypothetical protein
VTVAPPPLGDWLRDDPEIEVVKSRPGRRTVVLRRIDLWSALKVSLGLYFSLFLVVLTFGVLLWVTGRQTGVIGEVEELLEIYGGYTPGSYHFKDGTILRMVAVIGPILVVLGALATVAGVALFNALSRLFGGVELTVTDGDELTPPATRR